MNTYFGLRDYGTAQWDGGDPGCDHRHPKTGNAAVSLSTSTLNGSTKTQAHQQNSQGRVCGKCGAVRIDSQIGLEPSLSAYIATLVDVFRGVRRVLRDDGTLWLNIGDSYNTPAAGTKYPTINQNGKRSTLYRAGDGYCKDNALKRKDLLMVPARVAIALCDDGWYLRSDIIWAKPNPMPESVTDRPTSAHEHVFLLSKSPKYFYDNDAIRESFAESTLTDSRTDNDDYIPKRIRDRGGRMDGFTSGSGLLPSNHTGRNKRNVWTIPTSPLKAAHFATFPPKLVEPMILAGTSQRGCCGACGAPWVRTVDHIGGDTEATDRPKRTAGMDSRTSTLSLSGNGSKEWAERGGKTLTIGWSPGCACAAEVVPCTILDPFSGAGTTGVVAARLGRSYVGIELNPEYAEMSRRRIDGDAPMFNSVSIVPASYDTTGTDQPSSPDRSPLLPSEMLETA